MKRALLLAGFCLIAIISTRAQNKTLGVGTTTPNTNAALHVESPTSNQGFIMPRLNTTQRTGMAGLLTASDEGLMLYDTDLSTIFIWDGTKWKTTAEVAGGAKLSYPYKDSVTAPTGTTDLFKLQYNNAEAKRIVRIENLNGANGSSALSVLQQGTGFGGFFSVNNSTSGGSALTGTTNSNLGGTLAPVGVYGESTGTGSLGAAFRIDNPLNGYSTVYSETNGTGPALSLNVINGSNASPALNISHAGTGNSITASGKIQAAGFIGDGSTLTNLPPMGLPFSASQADTSALFDLTSTGTGHAAAFQNTNTGNVKSTLYVTSNGGTDVADAPSSSAILAETSTAFSAITGRVTGGYSNGVTGISTAMNIGSYAMYGQNSGLGNAGVFTVTNSANTSNAVEITNNGTAAGLYVKTQGTGANTTGAYFETAPSTSGATVFAAQLGTGRAGQFQITNAANNSAALRSYTDGTSNAGYFTINNIANTMPAIFSETNGTGAAIQGQNNGAANGFAGLFRNTDAANNYPAVQAETDGSGPALTLFVFNGANNSPALNISHAGTGNAISANGRIQATGFVGDGSLLTNLPSMTLPFTASQADTAALFDLSTTGTGHAAAFENTNSGNVKSTLYVTSNGGTDVFDAPSSSAILAETSTAFSAITGRVTAGYSNGVTGISKAMNVGSYAIYGQNTGLGNAGVFTVTNASNASNAVEITTSGTAAALTLAVSNATNSSPALNISHAGSGNAITATGTIQATGFVGDGSLLTNLPSMTLPFTASQADTAALFDLSTTGTGHAAAFENTNSGNVKSTLYVTSNGGTDVFDAPSSSAILAETSTAFSAITGRVTAGYSNGVTGISKAMNIGSYAIYGQNTGLGNAGVFTVTNASNASNAVEITTNGTAAGLFVKTQGAGAGDAVSAESVGGSAGNFRITNGTNTTAALSASTNTANGYALGLNHNYATASGVALAIFSGGITLSTHNLSSDSTIYTRAAAYYITNTATSYNFDGTVSMNEGDTFYFYNANAYPVTVGPVQIPASSGRTVIYLGGNLRGF
jgi:hypothetical protein